MTAHRLALVIAAGGTGERFGRVGGKQLAPVLGKPVLWWTMRALAGPPVEHVVLVAPPGRVEEYTRYAENALDGIPLTAVAGGASRQESVRRGLAEVPEACDLVAVHDGARPLVTLASLVSAVSHLDSSAAAGVVVGHPSHDTVKRVEETRVVETVDRAQFWIAQTPQVFVKSVLIDSFDVAGRTGFVGTDDASVVEFAGHRVEMVVGPRANLKVTTSEDLGLVEALLSRQEVETS